VVQQQSDGSFDGVVVTPVSFGGCSHPVAQVIWRISGSGLSYTGTHVWFRANCVMEPGGKSTWKIIDTDPMQYTLIFCTAHPGSGPPDPSARPSHPVGSTLCYSLTRKLSPSQTLSPPTSTAAPMISGTAKAGKTLSCSTGAWTGSPTAFFYQWQRDGTPIAGATDRTYKVQTSDEGLTLTCTVKAFNGGGFGSPSTSKGVSVPVPFVARCPRATGRLSGRTLGLVKLGMTRAQARREYVHSSNRGTRFKDFFCLTPIGVRVGYASPTLLDTLGSAERKLLQGRVVWASTSNALYVVHGVRPGATIAAAGKHLRLAGPFHIGLNYWYLAPDSDSTAVLKVRHGIVEEIGIGDKQITQGHKAQLAFLKSFS